MTRDKPSPHVGLHFLPRLNRPLMVSPSVHHKLITPYNSIVNKLNDGVFSSEQLWHSKINSTFFSHSKYASGLSFPGNDSIFILMFPRFLSVPSYHLGSLRKPLPRLSPLGTYLPSPFNEAWFFSSSNSSSWSSSESSTCARISCLLALGTLWGRSLRKVAITASCLSIKHHVHVFKLLLHRLEHEEQLLPSFFVWCVTLGRHFWNYREMLEIIPHNTPSHVCTQIMSLALVFHS